MRPLVKVIDVAALRHNVQMLRRQAGAAELVAVVKADAYGHGVAAVLPALSDVDGFAVASIDEALQLRQLGAVKPILLLEGIFGAEEAALCAQYGLVPCVHSVEQLQWLRGVAGISAWVKVDSGMHRLGFAVDDAARWLPQVLALANVRWIGVASHFACADADDLGDARAQLARLDALALPPGWRRCFANSAALFVLPQARADVVRAGLALYGMSPFSDGDAARLGLRPVLSLQTQVLAVRRLQAGEFAGYSHGFQAQVAGNLATIVFRARFKAARCNCCSTANVIRWSGGWRWIWRCSGWAMTRRRSAMRCWSSATAIRRSGLQRRPGRFPTL